MAPIPTSKSVFLAAPHVLLGLSSLGIARMSSRDDVYEGYLIPKGTIVLPNVWFVGKWRLFFYRLMCDPLEGPLSMQKPTQINLSLNAFLVQETYPMIRRNGLSDLEEGWAISLVFCKCTHKLPRICPGKALAENSLFAIIAGILSAFDIRPPLNADLNPTFGLNLVRFVDLCDLGGFFY